MKRRLSNLGFVLVIIVICFTFLSYKGDAGEALLLTILYVPIVIGLGHFISSFLIPNFLLEGRNLRFAIYLFYSLIISFFFLLLIQTILFITVAELKFNLMPPPTKDLPTLLIFLVLLVLLLITFRSLKDWRKAHVEKERASRLMVEKQLHFLQAQLNPHFLFNTLNNVYALSLEKSEKTPTTILKLSNLLDHILKRDQGTLILLKEELAVMEDYLAIEELRYDDKLKIDSAVEVKDDNLLVPPLLLITLLENCFTHGGDDHNCLKISYRILQINNSIKIEFSNNYSRKKAASRGIGLASIKEQLSLLFPNRFTMETMKEPALFTVKISIHYAD